MVTVDSGGRQDLTEEELEAKYGLNNECLLDIGILPPPSSPDFIALSKLTSFKDCFSATVIKCLRTLDETLGGMVGSLAEAGSIFFPKMVLPSSDKKEQKATKDKDYSMTEMESLFFLMLETLRLRSEATAKEQIEFNRLCVTSMRVLVKGVKDLLTSVQLHRKELKKHCVRLGYVNNFCKRDYPNAVEPAAELFVEFYLSTDVPQSNKNQIEYPKRTESGTSKMKFRCQPNGYSVFAKFPDSTSNWKDGITFDHKLQIAMMKGIISEFSDRIDFTTKSLQYHLSKILRTGYSYIEDWEGEKTGIKLETDKLYRLFEFRRLLLHRGDETTMVFLFMRIENNLKILNNTLYNLTQALMVLKNRIKYIASNCATWKLMSKKIIFGPISQLAEMNNYSKFEVPLNTQWNEDCVK